MSSSVSPLNGGVPDRSIYAITPQDQTSDFWQDFPLRASGAM
jgi:hypothetical protein